MVVPDEEVAPQRDHLGVRVVVDVDHRNQGRQVVGWPGRVVGQFGAVDELARAVVEVDVGPVDHGCDDDVEVAVEIEVGHRDGARPAEDLAVALGVVLKIGKEEKVDLRGSDFGRRVHTDKVVEPRVADTGHAHAAGGCGVGTGRLSGEQAKEGALAHLGETNQTNLHAFTRNRVRVGAETLRQGIA